MHLQHVSAILGEIYMREYTCEFKITFDSSTPATPSTKLHSTVTHLKLPVHNYIRQEHTCSSQYTITFDSNTPEAPSTQLHSTVAHLQLPVHNS